MKADFDLAVIGSGFSGSLLAIIARKLGRSVVLLERGAHPRFAIGESSTPLANLLLEELATRYDLPRIFPLSKWGTWQKNYPEISCGLKRGFTFFHHKAGQAWAAQQDRANELLVAASPHDAIADTHWYRADFDHFLVREAQASGLEYLDHMHLERASRTLKGMELSGTRLGHAVTIHARLVLDASGPRGFLHRSLNLRKETHPGPGCIHSQGSQALYSHLTDVHRWRDLFPSSSTPPYSVDDAALHHVFEGGWLWVLRFNNGLTSAGVAATQALANELRLHEGTPAWLRLLERFPSIREQFKDAVPQFPFTYVPQLSFRSPQVVGPNWALLPSAAGFIDPLLSTGFPLTLLGIARLAELLEQDWGTSRLSDGLQKYASATESELDLVEQFVDALYRHFGDFELFTALTLLYFAAASFTESTRRLGNPQRAGAHFLLGSHPTFGPRLRKCLGLARKPLNPKNRLGLIASIHETILPVDIAGLGNRKRLNHYPVLASDLLENASKLGASRSEILALLEHCGFAKQELLASKIVFERGTGAARK